MCLICLMKLRNAESIVSFFFFQAEDGIRDLVRSRGLGDVYKRQGSSTAFSFAWRAERGCIGVGGVGRIGYDRRSAHTLSLIHI